MSKQISICPCCGAKNVEYKHGLNVGLLAGLYSLFSRGPTPCNLKELNLTYNQRNNFQKLKYWDLVEHDKSKGLWSITSLGRGFMAGPVGIPKYVWTYRNERKRFDGSPVHIWEIDDTMYKRALAYIGSSNGLGDLGTVTSVRSDGSQMEML